MYVCVYIHTDKGFVCAYTKPCRLVEPCMHWHATFARTTSLLTPVQWGTPVVSQVMPLRRGPVFLPKHAAYVAPASSPVWPTAWQLSHCTHARRDWASTLNCPSMIGGSEWWLASWMLPDYQLKFERELQVVSFGCREVVRMQRRTICPRFGSSPRGTRGKRFMALT